MSADERDALLSELTHEEIFELEYDWQFWARPAWCEDREQRLWRGQGVPAGNWSTWLVQSGRGFGKTRIGAEWVRAQVESGRCGRLALVGRTAADVRDVMIEGESGILKISPPWLQPRLIVSKRRLVWPNGAIATLYTSDEPDQLRGPQHDGAWGDEPAAWHAAKETWDNLQFGLRLGTDPQCVMSTTPRPLDWLRELIADASTVITRGSLYENVANLAPSFVRKILQDYEGTRLGRQEIHGELLQDVEGALWTHTLIDEHVVRGVDVPPLTRLVVGVDPGPREASKRSETGIVVAGIGSVGGVRHGYVLADLSLKGSPDRWAKAVVEGYRGHRADRVVAEVNDGGDLVKHTIHTKDERVAFKGVHARQGKQTRAEPVAALYEQGRMHHVGIFPQLEDQMCTWVPGATDSPDRMDALVYALTELMLGDLYSGHAAPQSVPLEESE